MVSPDASSAETPWVTVPRSPRSRTPTTSRGSAASNTITCEPSTTTPKPGPSPPGAEGTARFRRSSTSVVPSASSVVTEKSSARDEKKRFFTPESTSETCVSAGVGTALVWRSLSTVAPPSSYPRPMTEMAPTSPAGAATCTYSRSRYPAGNVTCSSPTAGRVFASVMLTMTSTGSPETMEETSTDTSCRRPGRSWKPLIPRSCSTRVSSPRSVAT
mmetsp:Transcript_9613/g.23399  ORF Transcript_9613/g.23399 Transcript_9613/m.23399 type:complete len:216 (-) Transcript_9613:1409-2056(-)